MAQEKAIGGVVGGKVHGGVPAGKKAFWVTVKFPSWGDSEEEARSRAQRIELEFEGVTLVVRGEVLDCQPAPELETHHGG